MADELEASIVLQMVEVALVPGEQVVNTKDLVASFDQSINQMRPEKPRATGDENAPTAITLTRHIAEASFQYEGTS